MTVTIKVGRRVPRSFYKRMMHKSAGLFSFSENLWIIISRSLQMAKNAADNRKEEQVHISIERTTEYEDIYYQLEWIILTVSSPIHEKEVEEYNEAMRLYDRFSSLKNLWNKNVESSSEFKKAFRSKHITVKQFEEAKEKGYGTLEHKNISQVLNDAGIITLIEKDW